MSKFKCTSPLIRTWKVKRGNVADIPLFFGYMLKYFEIDYVFRFAGYKKDGVYEHVYAVARINNREYVLDLTAVKSNRNTPLLHISTTSDNNRLDLLNYLQFISFKIIQLLYPIA